VISLKFIGLFEDSVAQAEVVGSIIIITDIDVISH